MATVTQLSQGSVASGTTVALSGVSVIPGDLLCLFVATYSTYGVTNISNLGNVVMSNNQGLNNTNPYPNLWADNWYGIQTATVTSQTINVNFSYSANSAVILYRVRPDVGKQLVVKQRRNNTSTATSFTTGSAVLQRTDIAIGGCAVADNTYFTDSGTTGGSWSGVFYEEEISGSDIAVFGQTKIMNAQGSLPYNGSFVSAAIESAAGYLLVVTEQGKPYWGMPTL